MSKTLVLQSYLANAEEAFTATFCVLFLPQTYLKITLPVLPLPLPTKNLHFRR